MSIKAIAVNIEYENGLQIKSIGEDAQALCETMGLSYPAVFAQRDTPFSIYCRPMIPLGIQTRCFVQIAPPRPEDEDWNTPK